MKYLVLGRELMVQDYFASPDFLGLAASTRKATPIKFLMVG